MIDHGASNSDSLSEKKWKIGYHTLPSTEPTRECRCRFHDLKTITIFTNYLISNATKKLIKLQTLTIPQSRGDNTLITTQSKGVYQ